MKIEINRNRQNSSINKQQFKFDQIGSKIIKLAALTTAFFPAFSSPFYPFFSSPFLSNYFDTTSVISIYPSILIRFFVLLYKSKIECSFCIILDSVVLP